MAATVTPLLLTATAGQARFLRDHWAKRVLADGRTAWETPPILSLQAWLRQQWEQLLQQGELLPLLLSHAQERRAWQQCRPGELSATHILRLDSLVDQAMQAYRLFYQWRRPDEQLHQLLGGQHLDELLLFKQWQQRFDQQCEQRQWLPAVRLSEQIGVLIERESIDPPKCIQRYQSANWNRAEQALFDQLQRIGCEIVPYELEAQRVSVHFVACDDPQQEITIMADRLARMLAQNPARTAAVVVPDLAARRVALDHCLGERLFPQSALVPVMASERPYRFSCGEALSNDPRVYHALQLLRLKLQGLPLLEACSLLRSPWLLQGEEMEARSLAALNLRRVFGAEVSLQQLGSLLEDAPRFRGAVEALIELDWEENRLPAAWTFEFTRALANFEWADNAKRGGTELAAYDGWREGLDRLSSLGEQLATISAGGALAELRQLLSTIEPKQEAGRWAVEILTPEEAQGIHFDWLWVMGCDDRSWPPAVRAVPFLPLQWQRMMLPALDHSAAQQRTRQLFEEYRYAAGEMVCSFSRAEAPGAEADRHLSPLAGELEPVRFDPVPSPLLWWQATTPLELEPIIDQVDPLPEGVVLNGGSSLLLNQSQCPFRAFVRHRLQAAPLDFDKSGLDSRERGTLLHALMERCWQALNYSSEVLNQLDEAALQQQVRQLACEVVEKSQPFRQQRLGWRFAQNECDRLQQLVLQALALDRLRTTPFVIEEMEQKCPVSLGGLQLSIKMDRVDWLEDGRRLVIDYKSGKVNRGDWLGERPAAPQLPLYAVLREQVAAVLYAQVRVDEVAYKGEQQDAEVMGGDAGGRTVVVSEDWEGQLEQWHHAVSALAEEARKGVTTVSPLHGRGSCQYCGLEPLCRVETDRQ